MTWNPPASHPLSCRVCHGSGWQPGPEQHAIASGHRITYTTLEPCEHHWPDDDPHRDEYGLDRVQWISFGEYHRRLLARLRRGDPNAALEMAGWRRARGHLFTEPQLELS